jgi:hypothetical protein
MIDFADLKPGMLNFALFCAYYLLARTFLRFAIGPGGKWYIAGLSEMTG